MKRKIICIAIAVIVIIVISPSGLFDIAQAKGAANDLRITTILLVTAITQGVHLRRKARGRDRC